MGIRCEKGEQRRLIRVEDIYEVEAQRIITYADYVFDDSDNENDNNVGADEAWQGNQPPLSFLIEASCKQRCKRDLRRGYRLSQREKCLLSADGDWRERKNVGANKQRRIDNARLLISFADAQDICYDGSDLMSKNISAFSRLLNDKRNMKVWNEFVELDEADQRQILEDIDEKMLRPAIAATTTSSAKRGEPVADTGPQGSDVMRGYHPAYSAQVCFARLDKRYRRCLMRNRYVPMEFLVETEDQLRGFFAAAPSGVYVEAFKSRMKRFYFHAVAQFLALNSTTLMEDSPSSAHSSVIVQVANRVGYFTPPSELLVDFIRRRRQAANCAIES